MVLLRSQLESLSMGVVGLAHATLREPKLGESRQDRLLLGKELIEMLGAVRHWITHKTAPKGWDPTKLLSVGLRCAHPSGKDSTPGIHLPQIPQSVLQPEAQDKKDMALLLNIGVGTKAADKGASARNGRIIVETPNR